jgi:hypothetical protein
MTPGLDHVIPRRDPVQAGSQQSFGSNVAPDHRFTSLTGGQFIYRYHHFSPSRHPCGNLVMPSYNIFT